MPASTLEPVERLDNAERFAYTMVEVAAAINTSMQFVIRQMDSGALPTVKLDGARRVLRSDLIAFLEAHREVRGPDGSG